MQQTGVVFDIQKFSVHDGPGIRTTVFVKGCPLRCQWCHNPESQSMRPEIFFTPEKCVGCGRCAAVCPEKCHHLTQSHLFDRDQCRRCGKCAGVCLPEALELAGRSVTVAETLAKVLEDKIFYETSGGGMTVSGGEPMMQFDFALELARKAKENGLHVAMETCGFAPQENFEAILPYIDLFLFDIKSTDPEKHRKFTGPDFTLIHENLRMIDRCGKKFRLRCPLIPGVNDSEKELAGIAALANTLDNVQGIDIEPYHPL
ncbi:MAG: glycyl-radical enzyme activating protein, partial [Lentisphaeria bacterium]|nr:glycyl-radical enzyme activating protein [Lentisphaeria bacterium]